MTMIDINCWERGCACYDSRIADETVEVVRREWVGLADEEIEKMGLGNYIKVVRETEAKLRSKNERL
jgi:hypothetical protein